MYQISNTKLILSFIWNFVLLIGATAGCVRFFQQGNWGYLLSAMFALIGIWHVGRIQKLLDK